MDKFADLVPEERAAGVSKDNTCILPDVRFGPKADKWMDASVRPLCATNGPMQCSK